METQKGKKLPEQITTIQDPKKIASAPYNFVPLPNKIAKVAEIAAELTGHDSCKASLHTGHFEVKLETLTPLYIRAGRDSNSSKDSKENPDFFYVDAANNPVIPGSSIRGMLRNMLRIVSSGKIEGVSEKKLFFRAMDKSSLRTYYSRRMYESGSRRDNPKTAVKSGFLVHEGGEYKIRPCGMLRISRETVESLDPGRKLHEGSPCWLNRQNSEVWVRHDCVTVQQIKATAGQSGFEKGILVISGNIRGKKSEFVFLPPTPVDLQNTIKVSDELIRNFHDRDQLTQWQEKSFPKDKPEVDIRESAGWLLKKRALKDLKQPVFYLVENGSVTFLGRAQMFRLPYEHTAKDFIPDGLAESNDIDYADAIFGFVRNEGGKQGEARSGRVSVGDATLCKEHPAHNLWLNGNQPLTPKILSGPKPTCVQHYLVQDSTENDQLKHYGSACPDETVIRGFKQYWHHAPLSSEEWKECIQATENQIRTAESQYTTKIRPLMSGLSFSFKIHFNNLTDEELGALCWILHPLGPENHRFRHRLGMGKPLGLGTIELKAALKLSDQQRRYSELFSRDDWQCGYQADAILLSDQKQLKKLTEKFEADILRQIGEKGKNHLFQVKRIQCLLKLIDWPGYRPVEAGTGGTGEPYLSQEKRPNTRYMRINPVNEYKYRPILPDPLKAFGGLVGAEEAKESSGTSAIAMAIVKARENNPAPAANSQRAENVILLEKPNSKNIAKIKTEEEGEILSCKKCGNAYGKEPGHVFKARVTRNAEGKAIEAEFIDWKPKI